METGYLNDPAGDADLRLNWMILYVHEYTVLVDRYHTVVALQTFGHEHTDTFRLAGEKGVTFSVPSLSTAYPRTNPTARLWKYDRGAAVFRDWDQYYMDLEASNAKRAAVFHKSYSASEVYNITSDLGRDSMERVLDDFKKNRDGAYAKERRFFLSSTPLDVAPACDAWCQDVDLCDKEFGARDAQEGGFEGCVYTAGRSK